jgi:dTDP-4-dehydrorhamnose reductase
MPKKVLILGCTGMLGHTLLKNLSARGDLDVYATARMSSGLSEWFAPELVKKIRTGVDVDNFDTLIGALAEVRPDVVINSIGLIKQLKASNDPLSAINVNALLPHRISLICKAAGARMIHISTDCVFNGKKGNYTEEDPSDAIDLYGRSKFMGEVTSSQCVTLRTSIIGHELKGKHGLIEWFLAQDDRVRGYANAMYTGFTTIELTRIIGDYVLTNGMLQGVYHVASQVISKYELLKLVAERYGKRIEIERFENVLEDRSLDATKFCSSTGYQAPLWPEMIEEMYQSNLINGNIHNLNNRE